MTIEPTLDPEFDATAGSTAPTLKQRIQRLILAGLVVLAPVSITAVLLYQIFQLLDGVFAPLVVQLVGTQIPGVGMLLTLLLVLALGWLSTNVIGRRLIHWTERLVAQVPVGRSVYSASKSVLEILSQRQTDAFKRVVLIEYPRKGMYAIAFVTARLGWEKIHPDLADARTVFLPTTPNPTSGYLLLVPKAEIIDLPITVEEGVRLVISGGILLPKSAEFGSGSAPGVEDAAPDRRSG